jgi:hypothetical protein
MIYVSLAGDYQYAAWFRIKTDLSFDEIDNSVFFK